MIRLISLFLLTLIVFISSAQKGPAFPKTPPPPARKAPDTVVALTSPALPRTVPKKYKDIITDKAVTQKGLFTVHRVDDKYYFEIPDSVLYREIMAVTRFVKVPANRGAGFPTYGGELINQQTLTFEKGPSNNIFMRVIIVENIADTSNAIYKAVSNSNLNAIAAAFPIAAYGKDSASVVIDVTDFFKGDNQVVSVTPAAKRAFNLSILASDRSFIQSIHSFPINTEIRTVKTFSSSAGAGSFSFSPSLTVPVASAAGAITVELNTSMIILPKEPMAIRYWDRRVGYIPEAFTVFSDEQQKVNETIFALRWRMEPKDEDIEKWKRGELVEPRKPIVYYIDPATPKKWRKYLIMGVNDWQAAFEKAGFKNAISAREWPYTDTLSMEDARYSVLRYLASNVENAYGGNVNDPRSGEIISSDLRWYHNVMSLLHDWYMVQAAVIDPRARKMVFDDSLMGDLIRFVSSHEVGHTLGLLHNMASSSKTPVEKLRDKAWVEANGHTASIMDYARFNYVAQPEDNITSKGIYPRVGDYDKWAIRWGYGYIPGKTKEEQEKESNKLIMKSLSENPRTYFGTYELGNRNDPRNQSEDLGDNPIKASEYGIKNLKRVVQNLTVWTREDADNYENLTHVYPLVVSQFNRYMNHVAANVGGIYETLKSVEQAGNVYEPVAKPLQKQSVAFLTSQLFQTPYWLINKDILNKISQPASNETVATVQNNVLTTLLSSARLNRLLLSTERFGADTYTADALMNDVKNSIWSELKTKKPTDSYRRNLQKNYVSILAGLLYSPSSDGGGFVITFGGAGSSPNVKNTDVPSIARAYLVSLQNEIITAIPATADKITKYHLQDVADRIKKALNPKGD